MEHLSSCYFCGTAVDEPLEIYELPAAKEETTITLCSTCQQKLDSVLDALGSASSEPLSGERRSFQNDIASTQRSEAPGKSEQTITSDDTTTDCEQPPDNIDPSIRQADDIATGTVDLEEVLSETHSDESSVMADERSERDNPAHSPDGYGTDESVELGTESGSNFDQHDEQTDGLETAHQETDSETTEASDRVEKNIEQDTEDVEVDISVESTTDNTEREHRTSISALEYNRVMRLLQNREFPVNRTEIETIAASAYDLSEADCAEVIDIAIDRGLLAESDGQLNKPE